MTRLLFILSLLGAAVFAQSLKPGEVVRTASSAPPALADLGFYMGPVHRCGISPYTTSTSGNTLNLGISWGTSATNPGLSGTTGFVQRNRRSEMRTNGLANGFAQNGTANEKIYWISNTADAGGFSVWWRWGAGIVSTQKAYVGLFNTTLGGCTGALTPGAGSLVSIRFECSAAGNVNLCSGITEPAVTCLDLGATMPCADGLFDAVLGHANGAGEMTYYVKNLNSGASVSGTTGSLYVPDAGIFMTNLGIVCDYTTASVAWLTIVETCSFMDW